MITKGSYARWGAHSARMPRGWLVRSWSMGGSRGKESSGLAGKGLCVMQGIGLYPVDSGGFTEGFDWCDL